MAPSKKRPQRAEDDILDWFTISYSSLYLALGAILLVAGSAGYWFFLRGAPVEVAVVVPPPTVTTARFTSLEGSVKVKPVGKFEWDTADRNVVLRKSDLVRTGPGSTAEITFFDGTVVHVRPDSLITIEETSEDPSTKARKVVFNISSGEANFQTVRKNVPGSETKVMTPTVQGTVGELSAGGVRVADTGDSDFRLFEGSGKVTTKTGQTVELGASEAIKVDASGKAGPKVVLLGAPTLLTPPHQAEITYPNPSVATTLLLWKGPAEAVSFHLMLDYSAYFNRPLVDRKGIRDAQQELRGLEVGKYYWRVAAIDKNGEEGAFSDFARFTVAGPGGGKSGDGPPPPLLIEALDTRQNILQVKGKTEPGATVTVNGQRVEVEGDGGFNDFITLEKPGRQIVVIRATGLNGGIRELTRPVVVSY
jgi:hypothetical protein